MNKYGAEKEWRKILGAQFGGNPLIDGKIEETYAKLRKEGEIAAKKTAERKKRIVKRVAVWMGSAAAAFLAMVMFCAMNPVLAKEIPILGNIFAKVADVFSFGELPEEDVRVLYPDEIVGNDESGQKEASLYRKEDGGVTITLTEEYATNQAMYIGVCVENENEFPEMAASQDGTQVLMVETAEEYSFRPDTMSEWRRIEGKFEDTHTFIGIMRVDYSDINVDERRYVQMCKEAEADGMPVLTDENLDEYLDYYEVPDSFDLSLEITGVVGYLAEPVMPEPTKSKEELERMTDEEWEAYMKTLPQDRYAFPNDYENWYQTGSWQYDVNISRMDSASESRIIEVNEVNADGIGLERIEVSPVEMTLHTTEPAGAETFAVALDADGNVMRGSSEDAYVLAMEGHDISTVYVYICDYVEYMDELKGYAFSEAGASEKSFQEILEERALFRTEVACE